MIIFKCLFFRKQQKSSIEWVIGKIIKFNKRDKSKLNQANSRRTNTWREGRNRPIIHLSAAQPSYRGEERSQVFPISMTASLQEIRSWRSSTNGQSRHTDCQVQIIIQIGGKVFYPRKQYKTIHFSWMIMWQLYTITSIVLLTFQQFLIDSLHVVTVERKKNYPLAGGNLQQNRARYEQSMPF